ncbi:hypothetical protein DVH24_010398 [Malus domestica]|uniref:Uncharacterized protein n=1 Tax=Malus domestica TaxID=3750 RepID=A0A498JVT2_MALDO|nr:hypothetical protein DVH24_010398 [Malus domestica]
MHDCIYHSKPPLSEVLRTSWCHNFEAIPSLDNLTPVRVVTSEECHGLTSLLSGLSSCTSLVELRILFCEKLQYLPTGLHTINSFEEIVYLLVLGGAGFLPEFYGWPKFKSLPPLVRHSTSPVTEGDSPEWLDDLTSLTKLKIGSCKNLNSPASPQAM